MSKWSLHLLNHQVGSGIHDSARVVAVPFHINPEFVPRFELPHKGQRYAARVLIGVPRNVIRRDPPPDVYETCTHIFLKLNDKLRAVVVGGSDRHFDFENTGVVESNFVPAHGEGEKRRIPVDAVAVSIVPSHRHEGVRTAHASAVTHPHHITGRGYFKN